MIWKGERITITGATHFVASHLAEKLVMLGSNVRAFCEYDYQNDYGSLSRLPMHIRSRIEVIAGSLTNTEATEYAIENTDIVFHFGALDMVPSLISARDYLEKTIIGTFNMLNAAKKNNIQKFIHISNGEVYGNMEKMPINEECPLKAQSPHISGDVGAEKLAEAYYLSHNLPVSIARLFNTYGPMQSSGAIIPTIIEQGLVETRLLLGNMHAVRDFVYVKDIVDGLIKMAEVPESVGEAINLGSGQGISIGDLAEKIVSLIGRDVEILFDATRLRLQNSNIGRMIADIKKAGDILGWQPKISLETGIRQTIDWFSEHAGVQKIVRNRLL